MKKIYTTLTIIFSFNFLTIAQDWSLTGNAGTNASTNFIGTTDNVAFKVRTNNAVRMTFSTSGRVGIGSSSPAGKLHVKGNTNVSQLIIDASSNQSNINPLVKLRSNSGSDLMWIHSDNSTNVFIGFISGNANSGINNTAVGSQSLAYNTTGSSNTAVGTQALYVNTTGNGNTAVGLNALAANTSGFSNVAIGVNSLSSNTIAPNLVAIGDSTLHNNTSGYANTAVGSKALFSNISGDYNTAIGLKAQYDNVSGYDNIAVGFQSLMGNASGSDNIAIGNDALFNNETDNNIGIGGSALYGNITGEGNIAIGTEALSSGHSSKNTAIGYGAMKSNTGGVNNQALGYDALRGNTTGSNNTAIGHRALWNNTTKFSNIAIGTEALWANSGNYNIAIGDSSFDGSSIIASDKNTLVGALAMRDGGGSNNVALGYKSLFAGYGNSNVAIGAEALSHSTPGFSNNTACGYSALFNVSTSTRNTALGYIAGDGNDNGNYCTFLGAAADASAAAFTNSTAIGDAATFNAINKVRIGDAGVGIVEGQVAYSWPSDGRFKENIKDDVKGLEFILKLQPVSYNFNRLKYAQHIRQDISSEKEKNMLALSQIRSVGFIAQDVEKVIEETGFSSFDALHIPTNETDNYSLGYAEFTVPLVKAVQELSKELELLKSVLTHEQKQKLIKIKNSTEIILEQNSPNPFSEKTVVNYHIPSTAQSAEIKIYSTEGKELSSYMLTISSEGQIEIIGNKLAPGIYNYALVVDGKTIESKQMILTK